MKRTILSFALAAICAMAVSAKGDKDPVLMTVNNKPVKLSEFEYLYQKNNTQQSTVQPVSDYLDLFVIYKLKVAAAEDAGIDKEESFLNEYAGYCRDLSEPYMVDDAARDSLVHLIYDRMKDEVDVSHIMVARGRSMAEGAHQRAMLDSLRTEILAGRANFATVADEVSIDPAVSRNHGHMGYMSSGVFPYTFEDAAYLTPVGELSEVIETPFGYHVVKVHGRRPNAGQVKVQHILKLTRGMSDEEKVAVKASIDSIYTLLAAGADFNDMAMRESDDKGSARQGGMLDWFSTGRMVPEFEKVSFELNNGDLSKPFETAYGYHIVRKLDSKGIESFETLEPKISSFISRDERQYIPVKARTRQLREKYGTTVNTNLVKEIQNQIIAAGGLTPEMVTKYADDQRVIVMLKGDNEGATVATVFAELPEQFSTVDAEQANILFEKHVETVADNVTTDAERANLAEENADYRNLLNEYRDGMLLFEISDRNVWAKSKADTQGLENYFKAHRDKYATWTAPKFKGFVVFATSDSIRDDARQYLEANPVSREELADVMRQRYGRDVKVERVLAAKGENAIIDNLAFGGPTPETSGKWLYFFAYDGKIVDQPEEVADERGAVTTDYQNELEQSWIKQLRAKYPVKVDKKVLKKYEEKVNGKK